MRHSYIYMLMIEAYEKLRRAKNLEIEATLQMHRAELEDMANENSIDGNMSLDASDEKRWSKTPKDADK